MRCVCGADLPDGAMFCGECGRGVHAVVPAVSSPAATAATAATAPAEEVVDSAEESAEESATRVVDLLSDARADDVEAAESDEADTAIAAPAAAVLDEATRLPERRAPRARFTLHFSTGESVSVEGSGLIGRRPTAQPGEYFDEYVTLDDPGRSVSKTHLEFGQDGGTLWVSDRFSANGTVVREPGRSPRLCPGGTRARVARGSRVEIGEQFFIVS